MIVGYNLWFISLASDILYDLHSIALCQELGTWEKARYRFNAYVGAADATLRNTFMVSSLPHDVRHTLQRWRYRCCRLRATVSSIDQFALHSSSSLLYPPWPSISASTSALMVTSTCIPALDPNPVHLAPRIRPRPAASNQTCLSA